MFERAAKITGKKRLDLEACYYKMCSVYMEIR